MRACGVESCHDAALCDACVGKELVAKRGQARAVGQCWGERVARRVELRRYESWPEGAESLRIARRLVGALARDPRLIDELAKACVAGAAAWWRGRPDRYRA